MQTVYGLDDSVSVLAEFDNCAEYINCEHLSTGERYTVILCTIFVSLKLKKKIWFSLAQVQPS